MLTNKLQFQVGEILTEVDLMAIGERKRERLTKSLISRGRLIPLQLDDGIVQKVNSKPKLEVVKGDDKLTHTDSNGNDFVIPTGIERNGNWFTLPDGTKVMGIKKLQEKLKT